MHIATVRVRNLRSLADVRAEFASGLNLIMGPNNAGKSTLLAAMRGGVRDQRSYFPPTPLPADWPAFGEVTVDVVFTASEVSDELARGAEIHMPAPAEPEKDAAWEEFRAWLERREPCRMSLRLVPGSAMFDPLDPTFGLWDPALVGGKVASMGRRRMSTGEWEAGGSGGSRETWLAVRLARAASQKLRYFAPERRPQPTWQNIATPAVDEDLSNLAGALEALQPNTAKFGRFVGTVRRVLPEVHGVSVIRKGGAEVRVWFHPQGSEELERAVPSQECGSGMRQVLGILAAVVDRQPGQILLIDEPQSYLHPGALRRLLDVVAEAEFEQVIVATHAPETLARPNLAGVVHMEMAAGASVARTAAHRDIASLRGVLASVGASPGDAYAADSVLWVEGPSEVGVVRHVLQRLGGEFPARAIAILPVAHADRASGKAKTSAANVGEILALYERVAGIEALLPRTAGFLFDHDGRSDEVRRRVFDHRPGRISFTGRRMLENYLLDVPAVAELILAHCDEGELEPSKVRAAVADALAKVDVESVDGAALLRQAFSKASETRVSYDKVRDAPEIARRMLSVSPMALDELRALAEAALDGVAVRP